MGHVELGFSLSLITFEAKGWMWPNVAMVSTAGVPSVDMTEPALLDTNSRDLAIQRSVHRVTDASGQEAPIPNGRNASGALTIVLENSEQPEHKDFVEEQPKHILSSIGSTLIFDQSAPF